jgi:hypothetical protein
MSLDPSLSIALSQLTLHSSRGLLDLPVEVVENIIRWLMVSEHGLITPKRLYPFLLSNKVLFSLAVRHLYRVANSAALCRDWKYTAFETLMSSVRSETSIPYHQLIEEFVSGSTTREKRNAIQQIQDSILMSGNLRRLDICYEENPLRFSMEANRI